MTERVHQLRDVLIFIADAMDQDAFLHFSQALEHARFQFTQERADIAGTILRFVQLGSPPIEALQKIAVEEDLPIFTEAVQLIAHERTFITSETLRRVAEHLNV